MSLLLTTCLSKNYEYRYAIAFKNNTSDTLLLLLGTDTANYELMDSFLIKPYDMNFFHEGHTVGVSKDENVKRLIFSGGYRPFEEQARVYRNDSLKVTWNGPAQEMPDSIHHFYNYNSWEHWLIDEYEGIVQFTIYESDFE
ncbi:MAG: hypothetical protein R6U95_00810 [Bacteroidales bacterium]